MLCQEKSGNLGTPLFATSVRKVELTNFFLSTLNQKGALFFPPGPSLQRKKSGRGGFCPKIRFVRKSVLSENPFCPKIRFVRKSVLSKKSVLSENPFNSEIRFVRKSV
jgi:hypothetical protein